MLTVRHRRDAHMIAGKMRDEIERVFPRHIGIEQPVQHMDGPARIERRVTDQVVASVLDQAPRDRIVAIAVLRGPQVDALLHDLAPDGLGEPRPHQPLGHVPCRRDQQQRLDALGILRDDRASAPGAAIARCNRPCWTRSGSADPSSPRGTRRVLRRATRRSSHPRIARATGHALNSRSGCRARHARPPTPRSPTPWCWSSRI